MTDTEASPALRPSVGELTCTSPANLVCCVVVVVAFAAVAAVVVAAGGGGRRRLTFTGFLDLQNYCYQYD